MNAVFSACGRYRHMLSESGRHQCAWVMLNPSQAGRAGEDGRPVTDPTNNRVKEFSRQWGYDGYIIVNAYDLIATNPRDLWLSDVPAVSPGNTAYLQAAATLPLIVVAWGAHARRERVEEVAAILGGELWCLGVNDGGSPKHPLYLPYSTKLQRWPSRPA